MHNRLLNNSFPMTKFSTKSCVLLDLTCYLNFEIKIINLGYFQNWFIVSKTLVLGHICYVGISNQFTSEIEAKQNILG